MIRRFLAVLPLLLLTACAAGEMQHPKEPVITYTPVHHDVMYPANAALMSRNEQAALASFIRRTAVNPGGNIALFVQAPHDHRTQERIADIRRQLGELGHTEVLVVEEANIPANRIRVSSSEVRATAPDCPDWTYGDMANYRNSVLSNFGCAHATNLVRMVEDPNDLVGGTGDVHPDAERSSGVIDAYRTPPEPPASTGDGQSQTGGV